MTSGFCCAQTKISIYVIPSKPLYLETSVVSDFDGDQETFSSVTQQLWALQKNDIAAGRNGNRVEPIRVFHGVSKNKGTPKWMVYNGKPY